MDRSSHHASLSAEVQLRKAEIGDDGTKLLYDAPFVLMLADQAAAILNGMGAGNYVEFDMMPRADHARRPIRITVQWVAGESPAGKAARLEQENARLRASLHNLTSGLPSTVNVAEVKDANDP